MKWDNCVVYRANGDGEELGFKIVDWELADIGDRRWDVGAILQAYLSFWIMSIPVNSEMSPAQFVELAQYPLEDMQPAIRAFWKAYLETLQLEGPEAAQLLETCVQYGAARMIQTAYEYMQFSPQITPSALYLLQVSLNILKSPKEAINPPVFNLREFHGRHIPCRLKSFARLSSFADGFSLREVFRRVTPRIRPGRCLRRLRSRSSLN